MRRLLVVAALCCAALLTPLHGASAQAPIAGIGIGIGGVHTDMVADEVAATLTALGHKVFSQSAKYVEALLVDAETKGTVRVRFLFDDSASPRIKSVEFVVDDDKATRQYLKWYARLATKYGANAPREVQDGSVRETYCHSKNVSIVLALFELRTVLAYFYNPQVSGNCQQATARRAFDAVAYDSRPRDAEPASASRSSTEPPPRGGAEPAPRGIAEPAPRAGAEPMPRAGAGGPSPLAYAAHRSQRYQDTLRCIGVASFNATEPGDRNRWNALVKRLSNDLVGIGRREGLTPQQMNAEGRDIVGRNHGAYKQGKKDGNGTPYIELDREFCRANGMISG